MGTRESHPIPQTQGSWHCLAKQSYIRSLAQITTILPLTSGPRFMLTAPQRPQIVQGWSSKSSPSPHSHHSAQHMHRPPRPRTLTDSTVPESHKTQNGEPSILETFLKMTSCPPLQLCYFPFTSLSIYCLFFSFLRKIPKKFISEVNKLNTHQYHDPFSSFL